MEILNTVFTFVSNNILTKAEFFVGLIVLVGYILLGRKWYETLAGFLKAVVGYMILNVGSAGLINTFRPARGRSRPRARRRAQGTKQSASKISCCSSSAPKGG